MLELVRQLHAGGFGVVRDQLGHCLLAHDDLEPVLAVIHHHVLPLVCGAGEVGKVHVDRMPPFRLAAEPVDPAGPLLDAAGVPRQIVMDDMPAVPMQVHALPHHLAAHEDVREERCVECPHKAGARVAIGPAGRFLYVREGDSPGI